MGIRKLTLTLQDAFPLPYVHWYAATLLIDAGGPVDDVLSRIAMDADVWKACNERYMQLHFANTSWVAGAYQRIGFPAPETDQQLYMHLVKEYDGGVAIVKPFSMRQQLSELRRKIEANPRIGPFANAKWAAVYICERLFPVIRYVHNGSQVFIAGKPMCDRKGIPIQDVDPLTFSKLGERWFRDKNKVYGQGETPTKRFWFVVRGADPDSFRVLNERYAADKNAGYYITNRRLPTKEAGSFEIVGYYYSRGQKPGFHINESYYAKDSQKVYAYGIAIKNADAASFVAIGDEGKYFADKNFIYWEKYPIVNADRATFATASLAGQYCAYDKERPYYAGKPLSVTIVFDRWRKFFEAHPHLKDTWWHHEKTRREYASTE